MRFVWGYLFDHDIRLVIFYSKLDSSFHHHRPRSSISHEMPVNLKCEARGCTEVKTADDISTCIGLMQLHQRNVHECADGSRQKPPQISRPTLAQAISEDEWAAFTRRWAVFKNGTDLSTGNVVAQLIACCEPDLEATLFREDAQIAGKSEEEVLASMKRLAVLGVALSARRSQLLQTRQDSGEPVRQFVARLRGMASVCQWIKHGKCSKSDWQRYSRRLHRRHRKIDSPQRYIGRN